MSEGISIGVNCQSAIYGVEMGIRNKRENGYKTCPFDLMVSNYEGIVECLNDDFLYFCDVNYLELINRKNDLLIYNNKYKFIFNHESPGHAELYIKENWKNGIEHFILNNYEEFIKRYNKRIQNFRDYLTSGKKIIFLINAPNKNNNNDLKELSEMISKKYPNLNFTFTIVPCDKNLRRINLEWMQYSNEEINMILG